MTTDADSSDALPDAFPDAFSAFIKSLDLSGLEPPPVSTNPHSTTNSTTGSTTDSTNPPIPHLLFPRTLAEMDTALEISRNSAALLLAHMPYASPDDIALMISTFYIAQGENAENVAITTREECASLVQTVIRLLDHLAAIYALFGKDSAMLARQSSDAREVLAEHIQWTEGMRKAVAILSPLRRQLLAEVAKRLKANP